MASRTPAPAGPRAPSVASSRSLSRRDRFVASENGFTLIELLVVVSILSLLIALLLPALGEARATAKRVRCLSQVRQIALGSQYYANDHGERLPWLTWDTQGQQMVLLRPYITELEVYQCPRADQTASEGELWYSAGVPIYEAVIEGQAVYTDYKLNDRETLLKIPASNAPHPEWTVLAVDIDFNWDTRRHGEGENLGFLDGHSRWFHRDDYWYWIGNPLQPTVVSSDPHGNSPWYNWGQ